MVRRGRCCPTLLCRWFGEEFNLIENGIWDTVPYEEWHEAGGMFFRIMIDGNGGFCHEIWCGDGRRWWCYSTEHSISSNAIIKWNRCGGDLAGWRGAEFCLYVFVDGLTGDCAGCLDICINSIIAGIGEALPRQCRDAARFVNFGDDVDLL